MVETMAKILLVNPMLPLYFRRGGIHLFNSMLNPVSLSIICSILRKDYDVRILDANALRMPCDKVIREILSMNPRWVVITSNMMDRWQCPLPQDDHFLPILKQIRNINGIKTILLGPHPTIAPEKNLEYADKIVVGEPESAFPRIFEGKERIVKTEIIADLDSLPFPSYDMLPMKKYGGTVHVVTSRGCPFHCIFCYKGMYGNKYRVRDNKNVISELKQLIEEYNISHVNFLDLDFTLDRERILDLCDRMLEGGLNIKWSCGSRVDDVDLMFLKKMQSAGCSSMSFGAETGTDKILKKINKNFTLQDVRNAVMWAREAGIKTIGVNFVIGWPLENREDVVKSYNFFKGLPADSINCSIPIPYPDTPLNRIGHIGTNWDDVLQSAGTTGNSFTKKQILSFKKEIDHKMAANRLTRLPKYVGFILLSTNKRFNLSRRGIKNMIAYIRNLLWS